MMSIRLFPRNHPPDLNRFLHFYERVPALEPCSGLDATAQPGIADENLIQKRPIMKPPRFICCLGKSRSRILAFAVSLICAIASNYSAPAQSIPPLVNYQGRLSNPDG